MKTGKSEPLYGLTEHSIDETKTRSPWRWLVTDGEDDHEGDGLVGARNIVVAVAIVVAAVLAVIYAW